MNAGSVHFNFAVAKHMDKLVGAVESVFLISNR